MLLGITWPSKQPNETWTVEVDFANDLNPGESIQSVTIASKRRSDGVNSTSTFLGGNTFTGSKVVVRLAQGAGVDGEVHRVQFTIATSAPFSNTFSHEVDVPVEDLSQ